MHTAALWHHWIGAGDRAGAHPVGALVGPAVGTFVGALLGAFVGVFVVAAAQDEEEDAADAEVGAQSRVMSKNSSTITSLRMMLPDECEAARYFKILLVTCMCTPLAQFCRERDAAFVIDCSTRAQVVQQYVHCHGRSDVIYA